MNNKTEHLEIYGYIVKEENLETIDYKIQPNTFVVENLDPFPTYHGPEIPREENKPGHLFFVTKKKYPGEDLMRKTRKIQQFFEFNFVMDRAELHVYNEPYHALRIKNLPNYELIAPLQKWYADEGIEFMTKKKIKTRETTKVKKFFNLVEIEPGFYHDTDEDHIYYAEIEYRFNWSLFYYVSERVKQSLGNIQSFDAAYGAFYRNSGVKDVVRIYGEKLDAQQLKLIRNKYLELVSKV